MSEDNICFICLNNKVSNNLNCIKCKKNICIICCNKFISRKTMLIEKIKN